VKIVAILFILGFLLIMSQFFIDLVEIFKKKKPKLMGYLVITATISRSCKVDVAVPVTSHLSPIKEEGITLDTLFLKVRNKKFTTRFINELSQKSKDAISIPGVTHYKMDLSCPNRKVNFVVLVLETMFHNFSVPTRYYYTGKDDKIIKEVDKWTKEREKAREGK